MTDTTATSEHQVEFDRFWRQHVTIAGRLVDEFVARELYDFRKVMTESRTVYRALAGLERPDEDPKVVLAHAARNAAWVRVGYLRSRALIVADDAPGAADIRAALREIADRWMVEAGDAAQPTVDVAPVWMAAACQAPGHPDHEVEYRQIWRDHLVDEGGRLDQDKVAQVLAAYSKVIRSVSAVYVDVTGSAISKPNAAAHHVIDAAEEQFAAQYADYLCDEAYPLDVGAVKDALIALANQWHYDAWNEHLKGRQVVAALTKNGPTGPEDAAPAAA